MTRNLEDVASSLPVDQHIRDAAAAAFCQLGCQPAPAFLEGAIRAMAPHLAILSVAVPDPRPGHNVPLAYDAVRVVDPATGAVRTNRDGVPLSVTDFLRDVVNSRPQSDPLRRACAWTLVPV